MVNGSFGGGACGGYAFCGFSWFSNTRMLAGVVCLRCGYVGFW